MDPLNRMMKTAIIVAGGKGLRMQSAVAKQFMELDGRPVLMHTLTAFAEAEGDIRLILVLPEEQLSLWQDLCAKHAFTVPYIPVSGGSTRFESVRNGLEKAPDTGYIAVHDGVRPFILPETINRLFSEAATFGNAVPAIPPAETVRISEGETNRVIDRTTVRLIQTPQIFPAAELKAAYRQPFDEQFTDDAGVMEAAGHPIRLTNGQKGNIKITTREDFELYLRYKKSQN